MYHRHIEDRLAQYIDSSEDKIFFIWGPRRSGKTTVIKKIGARLKVPVFNFDLISDREKFSPEKEKLSRLAASLPIILIDEVQNSPESTIALKILHDEFKKKIIATGSSELRQKSKDFDSLAGRFIEHFCLPIDFDEYMSHRKPEPHEEDEVHIAYMDNCQMFGSYPEILAEKNEDKKIDILQNILDTYVLKDIIDIYDLRNGKLAKDILTMLALQTGQEVSLREIASQLGATAPTVSNYMEIFIKNYILIPLNSFKTNQRRAISQHRKIYFLDMGLRNILIKDFRESSLRPDKGALFENFIISELHKKILNNKSHLNLYFYREYNGREVDLVIEDYKKNYTAIEIKSSIHKTVQDIFPLNHKFMAVDVKNYPELLKEIV